MHLSRLSVQQFPKFDRNEKLRSPIYKNCKKSKRSIFCLYKLQMISTGEIYINISAKNSLQHNLTVNQCSKPGTRKPIKEIVLQNFGKFRGKQLQESPLWFTNKDIIRTCFLVNFEKCFGATFLKNTSLLNRP